MNTRIWKFGVLALVLGLVCLPAAAVVLHGVGAHHNPIGSLGVGFIRFTSGWAVACSRLWLKATAV
jgi:hypothetical protein